MAYENGVREEGGGVRGAAKQRQDRNGECGKEAVSGRGG